MSRFSDGALLSGYADGIHLNLEVRDPIVVESLKPHEGVERIHKALAALRVGATVIQMSNPALDAQLVKDEFGEMENRLKEHCKEMGDELTETLARYFKEGDGEVPKSLNGLFGDGGAVARIVSRYFDPKEGRLAGAFDEVIGQPSNFRKAHGPNTKKGILGIIEERISHVVQQKLDASLGAVLKQFSLDEDGSAMSRLKAIISDGLTGLNQALKIKAALAQEAERGHHKGFEFEKDLYDRIAAWGGELDDETELVRGTMGAAKQKCGDCLITLGETTGAPGVKIVVEAKNQAYTARKAIAELEAAKKNRGAACGIFAFAKGCEPEEFGDFKRR